MFGKAASSNSEDIFRFLATYDRDKWNWSSCKPPAVKTVKDYLARTVDSAPGIDGLPYAAWRMARDHVSKLI